MAKPKLNPDSETTNILVRVPVVLKSAAESKLKAGETLSSFIRAALVKLSKRK